MLSLSRRRMLQMLGFAGISPAVLAACNGDKQTVALPAENMKASSSATQQTTVEGAPKSEGNLAGTVLIDGSSTVSPITQAIAEEFQRLYPKVRVPVGISGSGGGFKKFCIGETDLTNASRTIRQKEVDQCVDSNIEFIELPVAFDGLAVLTNPENEFVDCLTVDELKRMWEPDAEDIVSNWSQIRDGFPEESLVLYGPGVDSGTYDYFTDVIVGAEGASRGDFTPSEDDNVLVQGIAGDRNAVGFFGLAYYTANADRLNLVAVDGGDGCQLPSTESVNTGIYSPLSRPLFIYVSAEAADRPEVEEYVHFYMENARDLAGDVGYVALSDEAYKLALGRFKNRVVGTVFGGTDVNIGASIEEILSP